MPATNPLYQDIAAASKQVGEATGVRPSSLVRLSLLVVGLIEARSCSLGRIAAALDRLGLTAAQQVPSLVRRLRRTLTDPQLEAATCYTPALGLLDWAGLLADGAPLVLAVDESSHTDRVHLLRLALPYRGGAIPVAWRTWEQQVPLPPGGYWQQVEALLADAAAALAPWVPPGVTIIVVADRAYDVPAFVDRVAARGWHWVVRAKANSQLRYRDAAGNEHALRQVVAEVVPAPGGTWVGSGAVFKDAGWRAAQVVVRWTPGTPERLVLLTDPALDPSWAGCYERRFWIEPSFRDDKQGGWNWEASQVHDPARQARLLLGLAWARLVVLCLGVEVAEALLAHEAARPHRPRPPRRLEHARHSLFGLGVQQALRRLHGRCSTPIRWWLPQLAAPSWTCQYEQVQLTRYLPVVPP